MMIAINFAIGNNAQNYNKTLGRLTSVIVSSINELVFDTSSATINAEGVTY